MVRWGGALAVVVAVIIGGLSTAVGTAGAAPRLDSQQLAAQVSAVVAPAYPDLQVGGVTCPQRIARRAGTVSLCSVTASGLSLQMKVTQTDGAGNVSVESTQAVIPKAKAEGFVQANATLPATVDCGPDPFLVRPPGDPFLCTATFSDGTTQQVLVAVKDVAGSALISLVL